MINQKPGTSDNNTPTEGATGAIAQYAEVLQRALQELRQNSHRDKEGNLCVGVIPEEVRNALKASGADGYDLIIHPLMCLGYLEYKRSYLHDFDDQYIEEFVLKEPEGLENWDTDRIIDDLFLSLREPEPGSRILP